VGSGGQSFRYYYGIIGAILERYSPKIVILDITYGEWKVKTNVNETDNLSPLLPFYSKSKMIKELILHRGKYERIKFMSKIYPFNSQITNIIHSFLTGDNDPNISMDGYIPMIGEINEPVIVIKDEPTLQDDSVKICYIRKIISLCLEKEVNLIIVNSPSYIYTEKEQREHNILYILAQEYGIEIWDYTNNPKFLKPYYFVDINHMNDNGAREFTTDISEKINGKLNLKQ